MIRALYLLLGLIFIGTYIYTDYRGREFGSTVKSRTTPGGIRSRTGGFYAGYHGGK